VLTAREYLRVSKDRSGRARSTEEQHDDNQRAADEFGFSLNGEAYSDVSLSASRYATKLRGDFGRLLDDLARGRFGADLLVLWEASRGSRKVSEWVDLLERCEQAGVRIHVVVHQRTYNPANHRDRRTLLEDAVDSEYQSAKSSDEIVRAAAANAAAGRPHGRTPYGYTRRYDPVTRRLVAQEPEPAEAEVVAELFRRLRQGHSLRAIERDFEARGILSRNGKLFSPTQLREMALRPVYAGLRVHEPGQHSRRYRGNLSDAVPATWPPLIDRETFYAVRALLLDSQRKTTRPGRGVHLLSMIALCGECGSVLAATYRYGKRDYQCHERACTRISADDLDAYAERVMLAYLSRDDVIEQLRAQPEGGELTTVRGELAEARSELASLRSAGRSGKLSVATLLDVEPGWVARVEALEARERELITPPALSMLPPGKDVARRWQAAPMSARRTVARLLCSPPILGTLIVNVSAVQGVRGDPAERVAWDRDQS
jgi:DNA invertase Pin-like site-specific DNA recombinase